MGLSEDFINKYNNLELFDFAHTPKCAGQFFIEYFKRDSQINSLGHTREGRSNHSRFDREAKVNKFTVIREPIDRFNSVSYTHLTLPTSG